MYQQLPQSLSPYILDLGIIRVHWYGAMYVLAFTTVLLLSIYRLRHEQWPLTKQTLYDAMLWAIGGVLIGGRLGYVLFYNPGYYLAHPIDIISPFQQGQLVGIAGMSYHGGLIGAIVFTWWFCKKKDVSLTTLADFLIPAIPLGYFFGRIGNFINKELYGRETTSLFGMDFGDGVLRHPSQLYEALFEGLILFIVLWSIRNKPWAKEKLLAFYLIGYGVARFCIEFVREPDNQLGFIFSFLTMGQLLSLGMIASGAILLIHKINRSQ